MKLLTFLLVFLAGCLHATESKYKDSPTNIDEETSKTFQTYIEKAQSKLDYFDRRFNSKKLDTFYVVTRFYQGDKMEQIFVKVNTIKANTYLGTISNEPTGEVKFRKGDKIEVKRENAIDWVIVDHKGEEEGNLLGKILDLMQIGQAVFILEPKKGEAKETGLEIVSVLNPQTSQNIIDIVPDEVMANVRSWARENLSIKDLDKNNNFTYVLVAYPNWTIIPPNK